MVAPSPAMMLVYALQLLSFAANADLVKDNNLEAQDIFSLVPEETVPENTTFPNNPFPGYGVESGEAPELVNSNPLAFANLFKRAGCSMYSGEHTYTCVDSSDICCTNPNDAQDGWCCANTAGCGPGTGSLGRCTHEIAWMTETVYETEYTTEYDTFTTSLVDSTEWTTVVSTDIEYVTRSDIDTATEWETVTVTRAAKKRSLAPFAPSRSTPLPASTKTQPSITPAVKQQKPQKPLRPGITEAPKVIKIRGLLFPRQTMRTETLTITVTRTSYITRSVDITTRVYYTETSTTYSTTTTTRTSALNAKNTVHSTTTLTLRPGQSAPSQPEQTEAALGGGGSTNRKGLTTGAKAGIGVGISGGGIIIAAIIAFVVRKKKNTEAPAIAPQHPGDIKQPVYATAGIPPGPGSPPPSDPRYSQTTQTPVTYSTPSPQPVYQPPNQGYYGGEMSATPAPFPTQQGQQQFQQSPPAQQQYQYPRPPSPMTVGQSPDSPIQQPAPVQSSYQQSPTMVPAVYSPQPQKPA